MSSGSGRYVDTGVVRVLSAEQVVLLLSGRLLMSGLGLCLSLSLSLSLLILLDGGDVRQILVRESLAVKTELCTLETVYDHTHRPTTLRIRLVMALYMERLFQSAAELPHFGASLGLG